MSSLIAEHQFFKERNDGGHFINLRDGEKIQYVFKTAVFTDAFWTHALFLLLETALVSEPLFL